MRTSELTGAALDWAVARCGGVTDIGQPNNVPFIVEWRLMHDAGDMNYSTDWGQGGPIIERERLWVCASSADAGWFAEIGKSATRKTGPTALIAAMRCYVASKLGDEVETPTELTGESK